MKIDGATKRRSDGGVVALAALVLTVLGFAAEAGAQSRQIPAPPQNEPVVIRGATVHTVSGAVIENGFVAFDRGRITDVGRGSPRRRSNARVLDGTGLHVYPGLIASNTRLGLTEVGAVDVTHDYSEYGRVKPEVRAAVAINPDSDLIPVTRANGILTAMVMPSGGLMSGRAALVRLDGWTWEDMAIDAEAGLVVSWPRTEPITAWWMSKTEEEQRKEITEDLKVIEVIYDQAQAYLRARAADLTVPIDLRFEAMAPAMSGEKPVFVMASSMGQIESAVAWAVRRNVRIVIVGGHQADGVIPLLVKHDIPVVINGLHRLPSRRHSPVDQPFALPRRLHEAGVRFCIASGAETAHERGLNHVAATAAAYGLSKDQALRSVTLGAAEILGIGETHGSIETGKQATLIVTNGDPLEITTDTLVAFIDGREIDLGSRHKALYEKYREKYVQLGLIAH